MTGYCMKQKEYGDYREVHSPSSQIDAGFSN
jgi:hypothetical protein